MPVITMCDLDESYDLLTLAKIGLILNDLKTVNRAKHVNSWQPNSWQLYE
jgi:hypothetical protein